MTIIPPVEELWSVNIQGPDDVFAAANRAEAIYLASKFNAWWVANFAAKGLHPYDPTLWAVPTPWTHDAALHASSLADLSKSEYGWLRDPASPPATGVREQCLAIIDQMETEWRAKGWEDEDAAACDIAARIKSALGEP